MECYRYIKVEWIHNVIGIGIYYPLLLNKKKSFNRYYNL